MQRVNFFSEDMLPQKDLFTFNNLVASVSLVLLMGGIISFYYSSKLSKVEQQHELVEQTAEDINSKISALNIEGDTEQDVHSKAESLNRRISSKQNLLNELENSFSNVDVKYSEIFQDIARVSVNGVWVTHINIRQGKLYLEGRASRPQNISRWLKQLRPLPSLKEKSFEEVMVQTPSVDKSVMSFKLYEKGYSKQEAENESVI